MPKKMYPKANPRKFIDKIALIKQKEALSNASFQLALHGLTEITMSRPPGKEIDNSEVKDNCSTNSYSPESFTSESTALSFKTGHPTTNRGFENQMESLTVNYNNDDFNSCHELSNTKDVFQNQIYYDPVKFRHGNNNTCFPAQLNRYSNITEYYPNNKVLMRLRDPVSSGSLPDVSVWRNPNEFSTRSSDGTKHFRDSSNNDHIDLRETLSNLENVKVENKSKAALLEHLKNRGMQNISNHHPHHIQSNKDAIVMGTSLIIPSPSLHRAAGHSHDHADSDCTGNSNESGHLKHFTAKNSPYVSISHRERHGPKEIDTGHRQRNFSGLVNQPRNEMKLNVKCCNDYEDYGLRNKALTPTGQHTNSWFENTKNDINPGLLYPTMFSGVLANENGRRVASDSNIQNSLKYQTDIRSQGTNFTDNTFQRVNSLKREPPFHPYQRNQSMTSYPTQHTHNTFDNSSQSTDYQREISQYSVTSSFMDSLLGLKSPDENLDPSLVSDVNVFRTPDVSQGQVFVFNDFPQQAVNPGIVRASSDNDNQEYTLVQNIDTYMDSCDKPTDTVDSINCDDIYDKNDNFNSSNHHSNGHECYWGHSSVSDTGTNNEQSPTIKPCENLDPQNVVVDINADFKEIPEITFSDVDAQRRDSLNWAVEVLGNLNSDPASGTVDSGQCRDRSMSVYQPMVALTEEDRPVSDTVNEV